MRAGQWLQQAEQLPRLEECFMGGHEAVDAEQMDLEELTRGLGCKVLQLVVQAATAVFRDPNLLSHCIFWGEEASSAKTNGKPNMECMWNAYRHAKLHAAFLRLFQPGIQPVLQKLPIFGPWAPPGSQRSTSTSLGTLLVLPRGTPAH